MAKKKQVAKKTVKIYPAKSAAKKQAAPKQKSTTPSKKSAKSSTPRTKIVFDEWDSYVGERDGVTMFISFDDGVTREKPPAELRHCARVLIPIHEPNDAGGPVPPESELLYALEDELCALLKKHRIQCRLVGRLTYGGWRELVFQFRDFKSFRPPVGHWMISHQEYEIGVSEHKGWAFFDDCIRPTEEDRLFMADRNVIDALVESGSNPNKKHTLDFAFRGEAKSLRRVAKALLKRGYKQPTPLDDGAVDDGTIEFTIRLPLDLLQVTEESLFCHQLASKTGVEFLGWGAAVVE